MALLLGLELPVLRARLVDLKSRGILSGPFEDGRTTTWKSWFPSVQATTLASERSGLRATNLIRLRKPWWGNLPAKEWGTA